MLNHMSKLEEQKQILISSFNQLKHPVSVPRWGLLDSLGKMADFQKFPGVRISFPPERPRNPPEMT